MVKKIAKGKMEKKNKRLELKKSISLKHKQKNKKASFLKRAANFCKELKSELKKVVWPTKKNIFSATAIVFVFILIMTLFVMFADYIFHGMLNFVFKTL